MGSSSPKAPVKTQQEKAIEVRQQKQLSKEIEESEERFAALARGKLGRSSLLSGAATTAAQAAGGTRGGGSRTAGSLLGGSGGVPQAASSKGIIGSTSRPRSGGSSALGLGI